MSKINVLSSKIYNRISAGEVVERPASVVKELIENSIDAGAKSITIEIIDGGLTSVKIIDDGYGMNKEDLALSILPHATSKLKDVDDLNCIKTLGFRGEALPSIASVSKLQITTKTANSEFGSRLYTEGGDDVQITETGAFDGTEVIVSNLFFNIPARSKFLKSVKGEESEITSYVSKLILANPFISFKYYANDKLIYQSFGDGFESAFVSIFGVKILNDCFYIDTEKNGIKLSGYISKHYFTKPNRGYQTACVNGRYVINQTISSAVSNAYSSYLMKRQFPFYVIYLSVPEESVDVNVHPNKLEIRFSNNQIVYSTVYSILSKVLDGRSEAVNIIVENDKKQTDLTECDKQIVSEYEKHEQQKSTNVFYDITFNDSGRTSKPTSKKESEDFDIFLENKKYLEKLELEQNFNKNTKAEPISIKIDKKLKFIGQALNTFLILEDGEDLYLIDQHAAHERLIFDSLKKNFNRKKIDVQPLILPYVIEVNDEEFSFIKSKLEFFKIFGMEIEEFGFNSYKISTIPLILSEMDIGKFFDLVLADLNQLKQLNIEDLLFDKFAQKACKSAVKAGDKLTQSEIDLIIQGVSDNLGLKCPHGRPVVVKIIRQEIDKWFKRIL